MLKRSSLKRYSRQFIAIMERNIYLELYTKSGFLFRYINPLFQLLILVFVFGLIFNIKEGFSLGYWNNKNYILFLLLAFCIQYSIPLTTRFNTILMREKFWKTLSAMMVAPVNRVILLFGILASELVLISVPFAILFIIALILFPISFIYLFLILIIFLSIFLIFASIGLFISAFGISHEEYVQYFSIILRIAILFSCNNYPKEVFPVIIQYFIQLDPLFYFFDLLRLTWYLGLDYEIAIKLITPIHIIVVITSTIVFPIFSIYLFNRVFKKYGITGY